MLGKEELTMLGEEEVAMLGEEEVTMLGGKERSCFPPPAAGGWDVIPAPGQCPQEQEISCLSSGMVPLAPPCPHCSKVTFLLDTYQVRGFL